jgi:hypothetical protein
MLMETNFVRNRQKYDKTYEVQLLYTIINMFWIVALVCGLPTLLRTEQLPSKHAIPSTVNGTAIKGFAIDRPSRGDWFDNGSIAPDNTRMAKKNNTAKNTYNSYPRGHRLKCTYIHDKVIILNSIR